MGWGCAACGGENPEGMRFCGHCGAPADGAASPPEREKDVAAALRSFVSGQVADKILEGGGAITDERRLVTCLFADLSGFTPLADRLDPEELLEIIDPVIQELTSIVGRYEGYVDKFAGDALLAFFGAPISHEDDAERALAVAEDMHAALARMLPGLPSDAGDLTLHIGVNTGHVIARLLGNEVKMDYSVLGDAVILAQRLESAAPAGETYVGATTHLLTKRGYDFESVGELDLKGKKEPVSAWRLVGRRSRRSHLNADLIGRSSELGVLEAAIRRGLSERSVAVITGAPGMGKTSLLQKVRQSAEASERVWLQARCLAYGAGIAYWPFIDVIRRVAGITPNDPIEEAVPHLRTTLDNMGLGQATPYLMRLLGYPSPEVAHHGAEDFRRELHLQLSEGLRKLAEQSPLVLVLEDAHWADLSSLELAAQILEACESTPLTVIISARPEGRDALRGIIGQADVDAYETIELDALDASATKDLIATMLGSGAPARLAEVVWEKSGGNPLFTHEVVRSLLDAGTLKENDGRWTLEDSIESIAIPPTIEGVLSARMDLLPRGVAPTLQMASVIGRRVRIALLETVHPEPDRLHHHLETLVETGFFEQDNDARRGDEPELVFRHALMQDVAYARLLRKTRRNLHQRVAEAAERLYGAGEDTIDLLARHLYLGERGPKAIDYLMRAGKRSASLFANEEAIVHLSRAAELARKEGGAAHQLEDILFLLGELHELRGAYEDAHGVYLEMRDRGSGIKVWRGLASTLRNQSRYEEVHSLLDTAFSSRDFSAEELAGLWLERGWTHVREGRFTDAASAFQEGLQAKGDIQDLVTAEILVQLAGAETAVGELEGALEHGTAGAAIFEREGNIRDQASAMRILGDAYRELGRHDEAAGSLRRGIELAERVGSVEEIGGCLINLGRVEMERNNLDDATFCDRRAAEQFELIGHPMGRAVAYGNLAEKLMMLGKDEEAGDIATKAKRLGTEIEAPFVVADANRTLARIHIDRGELEKGAELAEEGARIHEDIGFIEEAIVSFELAAEALEKGRHDERALELRSRAQDLLSSSTRD